MQFQQKTPIRNLGTYPTVVYVMVLYVEGPIYFYLFMDHLSDLNPLKTWTDVR